MRSGTPERGSDRTSSSSLLSKASSGLIIAALSFLGATTGSWISGRSTEQAARITVEAQTAKEKRDKRAEVYSAYLAAADNYSIRTGELLARATAVAENPEGEGAGNIPQELSDAWAEARSTYQDNINELYVYGSDDAWTAHQGVASELPNSLGPVELHPVDSGNFITAYRGMQEIFCKEAVARPRAGC